MNKETFSRYGWIIIIVLILAVMISFAAPFGNAIASGVNNFVNGFGDAMNGKAGGGSGSGSSGIKLDAPTNLTLANNQLSFDLVPNANQYILYVNDEVSATYATSPIDVSTYIETYGTPIEFKIIASDSTGVYENSSPAIYLYEVIHVDETTGEILDSWEQIIASVNDGSYATKYAVGNYKPLDLGSEGIINMQIAALDADVLSNGKGNAPITFIAKELLATKHNMNSTGTNANGWAASELRTYLSNDIYALIPATVQSAIVAVDKTYYDKTTNSTLTCSDKLWIPSYREVGLGTDHEDSGVIYSELFTDDASRIKTCNGYSYKWWLRSANFSSYFCVVNTNGSCSNYFVNGSGGVALGFCM